MTDLSTPGLAQALSDFVDKQNRYFDERIKIDYGDATYVTDTPAGQPGPGWYPLTAIDGQVKWIPCPARVRADALLTTTMDLRDPSGNLANSYTLRPEHSNKMLRVYSNGGATATISIPANLGAGFNCMLCWVGPQTAINVTGAAGVTIQNAQGIFRPNARYSIFSLFAVANNLVVIAGDLKL